MNITEQILTLKNISEDFNLDLTYLEIKLTKKHIQGYLTYTQKDNYTINIEDYLNNYECVLDEIGYLTYPANIHNDFSNSLYNLIYHYDYRDITIKNNHFSIPIELYIQNNKLGVSYRNGTMLNVFGDSVQEIIDNLNTMCNNNHNFKLHLNEKFTNLLNKD